MEERVPAAGADRCLAAVERERLDDPLPDPLWVDAGVGASTASGRTRSETQCCDRDERECSDERPPIQHLSPNTTGAEKARRLPATQVGKSSAPYRTRTDDSACEDKDRHPPFSA